MVQQKKKKIDELKIFNLHTTFKSKTELIFMYLIVISKYETQDIFLQTLYQGRQMQGFGY